MTIEEGDADRVTADRTDHRPTTGHDRPSLARLRLLSARAMNIPATLSTKDIKELGAALLGFLEEAASK